VRQAAAGGGGRAGGRRRRRKYEMGIEEGTGGRREIS